MPPMAAPAEYENIEGGVAIPAQSDLEPSGCRNGQSRYELFSE